MTIFLSTLAALALGILLGRRTPHCAYEDADGVSCACSRSRFCEGLTTVALTRKRVWERQGYVVS